MITYAGIGSRATPKPILHSFEILGAWLASHGALLRSGGADGADSAFELGCDAVNGPKEIFLPWEGFNDRQSPYTRPTIQAYDIAYATHPNFYGCTTAGRCLLARNGHQILGYDLNTPADVVLCWTQDGLGKGGTGQALRVARKYGVPIFDFGHTDAYVRFRRWLLDHIRMRALTNETPTVTHFDHPLAGRW